jgi:hypothetical protein
MMQRECSTGCMPRHTVVSCNAIILGTCEVWARAEDIATILRNAT